MCSRSPPLDSLNARYQRGGSRHIRSLILPRRAGQAPHCAIGSWAPLNVLGRSTLAAPPCWGSSVRLWLQWLSGDIQKSGQPLRACVLRF
uniref:Uncharacterized protein n=1 Tax=Vibrio cholerae TaxID=666 RepID=Q0GPC7_VIBCL|nr:unknown [Vibrio cholerae]